MTENEIIAEIRERRKKGEFGRIRVSREFNISKDKASRLIRIADSDYDEKHVKTTQKSIKNMTKKGLSMDEIRSKHDNLFIVRKNAEQLSKNEFLPQSEFVMGCSFVGNSGYRNAVEHAEFAKYRGKAGTTIYWSHPDSIKQLKDEGIFKDC